MINNFWRLALKRVVEVLVILGLDKSRSLKLFPRGFFILWNDQRGTITIMGALSITALFGFTALAIDVASWQTAQKSMQGAADMAAYSAGIAEYTGDGTPIVTQAKGITASMGYVASQNGVTVTVNQPPQSGTYTSIATAIEVIVAQPQTRYFSGLFLPSNPTVSARAVVNLSGSGACILALNPTANKAINLTGNGSINSPDCDVKANSNSSNAINMAGSSTINANCLAATGGVNTNSNLTETCAAPKTGAAPSADPYASVPAPTASGSCRTVPGGSPITLSPGNYCSGLSVGGGSVTFQPGVYYVNGDFSIGSNVTANGAGVTFFVTGSTSIGGGAAANLSAPTSGTYSGIVFFGSRTTNGNNTFGGSSTGTITGVMYFPTQSVSYSGTSSSGTGCTQIIADTIQVGGTANLNSACKNAGTAVVGLATGPPKLVE